MIFLILAIGLVSGIIGGMGIGGGTVLIPALVLLVKPTQQIAQSVNLLFFIPTAIVALIIHIKNKRIKFKTALPIIISGMAGAVAGSLFAVSLEGSVLRKMFGVFLFIMGGYEMLVKEKDLK